MVGCLDIFLKNESISEKEVLHFAEKFSIIMKKELTNIL